MGYVFIQIKMEKNMKNKIQIIAFSLLIGMLAPLSGMQKNITNPKKDFLSEESPKVNEYMNLSRAILVGDVKETKDYVQELGTEHWYYDDSDNTHFKSLYLAITIDALDIAHLLVKQGANIMDVFIMPTGEHLSAFEVARHLKNIKLMNFFLYTQGNILQKCLRLSRSPKSPGIALTAIKNPYQDYFNEVIFE